MNQSWGHPLKLTFRKVNIQKLTFLGKQLTFGMPWQGCGDGTWPTGLSEGTELVEATLSTLNLSCAKINYGYSGWEYHTIPHMLSGIFHLCCFGCPKTECCSKVQDKLFQIIFSLSLREGLIRPITVSWVEVWHESCMPPILPFCNSPS